MTTAERSLKLHRELKGKIEVTSRAPVRDAEDLSLLYTPGVAAPCLEIKARPEASFELTRRANLVAVVTDGSAVLGLGDIGPEAGMPVMEGKCLLFREFAGIDAFPICVKTQDIDEFTRAVYLISGSFGGINLEDIAAPRCFEIERRLKEMCDIPVFHDDQHGTAVVTGAALINALKLVGKSFSEVRVVISGAGSAGTAIARHLTRLGCRDIVVCDRTGILKSGERRLSPAKEELAGFTNPEGLSGTLADALRGADVFVGVSAPGVVTPQMVRSMREKPVVLAMANPTPEIMPDEARAAGAYIVGTGRSDFPNQINNVLAFPGIFRGALDTRARDITGDMLLAATRAIAGLVPPGELRPDYIVPSALDRGVAPAVASAVALAAKSS